MKLYPPYLDLVHERCPKAAHLYTRLWREKGDNNLISYEKDKIVNEYSISWKSFIHELRLLKKESVINFSFNSERTKVKINLFIPSQSNEKVA